MSLPARVSSPLARFDPVLNGINDATIRWLPFMWWPIGPPRADRPYGRGEHAHTAAWTVGTFVLTEIAVARQPEEMRRTGTALAVERVLSIVLTLAGWVAVAGAWDRRAERLRRRPWRQLLGRAG